MDIRKDINSYINSLLLVEGAESRNMKLAKHYLYDKFGYDEATAMKVIGGIKTDIPNSRLGKCKFMLAMVRMFGNGEFNEAEVIMGVNKCLRYAASDAHINEYDNNLNGLSSGEFIKRFSGVVSQGLQDDMNDVSSQEYFANDKYEIIKIKNFAESEEFADYVDWCVTYDRNMYNSYTNGGNGCFYFCLRDGYEDEERVEGEGCPLDSYGLSMIAVSVNSDGSCNTITCRWNHANGGNDNIMTTKELSKLLGVNFYDVFKPLTKEEIEYNRHEMLYEVEEELTSYMGYYGPEENGCDKLEYDPAYGDKIEQDVYVYYSENVEGSVLIDGNWNLLSDEIFDRIWDREGDIVKVIKNDLNNFLTVEGKLLSDEWFDEVTNYFMHGVGLCYKNGKWNAIRKDGSFVFGEWYKIVELAGIYSNSPHFRIYNDNNMFMLTDINGNPYFDRWLERIFKINDFNSLIKFEGDGYYSLIDNDSHKIKAPYKIAKLNGWYKGFYRVDLIDGRDCLINDNGSFFDTNTKKIIYLGK